jgi:DNA-binding NarL/FixJ family response regulator
MGEPQPGTLSVFVVEDDPLTRELLLDALAGEAGFVCVGSASEPREALAALRELLPDAAIVDLALGDESGVDLIAAVRQAAPSVELLAHTVFDDRNIVFRALAAGASGYLLKGAGPSEIARALREIVAGGSAMSPKIARLVIGALQAGTEPDPLSPREREILRAIDAGRTYKEIAEAHSISVHTVHSHVKNVYQRLQATSRKDAVARARRRGLL